MGDIEEIIAEDDVFADELDDFLEQAAASHEIRASTTFRVSHRSTILACMLSGIRLPNNCFPYSPAAEQLRTNYAMLTDIILGLHAASCALDLLLSPTSHDTFCFSASALLISLLALLQSLYLREHTDEIRDIVDLWDIVFMEDEQGALAKTGRFMEIHQSRYNQIHKLTVRMCIFSAAVAVCFTLSSGLESIGVPESERALAFKTWYPFNSHKSPMYEVTLLFQMFALMFVGLKQAGFDSILLSLITLQTSQLQLLRETLGRLFVVAGHTPTEKLALLSRPMDVMAQWADVWPGGVSKRRQRDCIVTDAYAQRIDAVSDLLRGWIHQHEETLRAGMNLDHVYAPILGIKFAFSILIVTLPTFAFTWTEEVDWAQIGLVIVLMTGNILDMYHLCKAGDDVDRMSESVVDHVYESPLFEYGRNITKSLQFIFQRVESHVHISALGMFPLSLSTYARIFERIASYYITLAELSLIKKRNNAKRAAEKAALAYSEIEIFT